MLYLRDSERLGWLGTGYMVKKEAREVHMAVTGTALYITLERCTWPKLAEFYTSH